MTVTVTVTESVRVIATSWVTLMVGVGRPSGLPAVIPTMSGGVGDGSTSCEENGSSVTSVGGSLGLGVSLGIPAAPTTGPGSSVGSDGASAAYSCSVAASAAASVLTSIATGWAISGAANWTARGARPKKSPSSTSTSSKLLNAEARLKAGKSGRAWGCRPATICGLNIKLRGRRGRGRLRSSRWVFRKSSRAVLSCGFVCRRASSPARSLGFSCRSRYAESSS